MKIYILHWLGSIPDEEITGHSISDAFTHAGYSAGAIKALDWYEEKKEN